jgi:hypothetical protein
MINDLLKALQTEERSLTTRLHCVKMSLQGIKGYYCPSYTEEYQKQTQDRLDECVVAIKAIQAHRRSKK